MQSYEKISDYASKLAIIFTGNCKFFYEERK